jgi:predicted DNA-binding protein
MEKERKTITIRLSKEEYDWLIQESERDERSKSFIIKRALKEYRAKLERQGTPPHPSLHPQ